MDSEFFIEDFLYYVPEKMDNTLGDKPFQKDFDNQNENWIYYRKEKNDYIQFLVKKGNKKVENSVYISSGVDVINVSNELSDNQEERLERLLRLTMEADYVDYCVSKVKYMKKHNKFRRLSNDERFSTLIYQTNSFIEVEKMVKGVEDENRIRDLFDFDPLNKLEKLRREVDEKSFVPNFKSKT